MALQEAPPFWWKKPGWQALTLSPLSWVYGQISARRMERSPSEFVSVPVICVGNFIAGGAGKTPSVLALVKSAKAMKLKPGILSRGFGGGLSVATLVDLSKHDSRDVGDEPLLLARAATTVVAADRPAGARLLVESGCDLIIMDDGFQNSKLHKDYCLVVVDAKRGIGNGHTHPSGPLRLPVSRQLPFADTVVIIGEGNGADKIIRQIAKSAKPIELSKIRIKNTSRLKGRQLLAYAGIADPDKFFTSLSSAGAEIVECHAFGDHHHYHDDEIEELIGKANKLNLRLVSTSKDISRLQGLGNLSQKLVEKTDEIEIELIFENPEFLPGVISAAMKSLDERGWKKIH
jgi:tetraacyldisaccharide 4'-kinase